MDVSETVFFFSGIQSAVLVQVSGLARPPKMLPKTKIQAPNSKEIPNFNIQWPKQV